MLDEAEPYVLGMLIRGLRIADKAAWEQTRVIAYITAQANSTKRFRASDIMPFPWDSDDPEKDTSVSAEDMDRLRDKARRMEDRFKTK